MVQTRSQTRAGAPEPPTLWPDAVVPPSPPPTPPPPPTLVNILTANNRTEPLIPILASFYQYLNGVDLDNLTQAFPSLGNALHHPSAPLPSFRCQDHSPLPSTKVEVPFSPFHLRIPQPPPDVPTPRQPCPIPPHYLVTHHRCEGPALLGYMANHSRNFWVCIHCNRRAWERYNLTTRPIGYDLCLPCSRNFRSTHPVPALHDCLCQWGEQEHHGGFTTGSDESRDLYLCHTCRDMYESSLHQADFDRLRGYNSNMDALHVPNIAGPWGLMPGPATRVVHLINNKGPWGESTCICGRSVTEKFNTYPALAPGQRDFRELVRVCVHCGEEKFLVPRYAF